MAADGMKLSRTSNATTVRTEAQANGILDQGPFKKGRQTVNGDNQMAKEGDRAATLPY